MSSHNCNKSFNGFHKTAVGFQDNNKMVHFALMFYFFNHHTKFIIQRRAHPAIDEDTIAVHFLADFSVQLLQHSARKLIDVYCFHLFSASRLTISLRSFAVNLSRHVSTPAKPLMCLAGRSNVDSLTLPVAISAIAIELSIISARCS